MHCVRFPSSGRRAKSSPDFSALICWLPLLGRLFNWLRCDGRESKSHEAAPLVCRAGRSLALSPRVAAREQCLPVVVVFARLSQDNSAASRLESKGGEKNGIIRLRRCSRCPSPWKPIARNQVQSASAEPNGALPVQRPARCGDKNGRTFLLVSTKARRAIRALPMRRQLLIVCIRRRRHLERS